MCIEAHLVSVKDYTIGLTVYLSGKLASKIPQWGETQFLSFFLQFADQTQLFFEQVELLDFNESGL